MALVIGNDSYTRVKKLDNARADARAMAEALEAAGFKVTLRTDASEKTMREAVRIFKSQLRGGDVAVFFFSGHGVQFGSTNYLLPVDISSESEDQVKDDSLPLQRVLDDLQEQKAKFSLAIIDACRDNPFRGQGRAIGGRGLAPTTAATGQIITYSAGAGQQALDRLSNSDTNPNGVFTRVLLREMERPGVSVDRILRNVRDEVVRLAKSAGHDQVPALYDQVVGDFYFRPSARGAEVASAAPAAAAQAAPARIHSTAEIEQQLWDTIKDSKDGKDFQDYLAEYPSGRFAAVARARVKTFQAAPPTQLATAAPSVQTIEPAAVADDLQRLAAGAVFRDCANCPEIVVIPPGNFNMGSPDSERGRDKDREGPLHSVTLPRLFGVGKFEITKAQFAHFVQETGYVASDGCYVWNAGKWKKDSAQGWPNPGYAQSDNDPVVCVSWDDAKAYTQWLTRKAGKAYRLLTEAEWEYAARAGSRSSRPWGDDPVEACRYANVADATARTGVLGARAWMVHACDDGHAYTAPVGSYLPNAFGLHDMIGNVWEWTEDCWNENYARAPGDGSATTAGDCDQRVRRGGSWDINPFLARSANRAWNAAGVRDNVGGFRVARTVEAVASAAAVPPAQVALQSPTGDRYEGDVFNVRGAKGRWIGANGDRYEGDFAGGMPNGTGTYEYSDGQQYQGEVSKGVPNGRGVFVWPNRDRYEGEFYNGKMNGRGEFKLANGDHYKGDFRDGKMNGHVEFKLANGDHYIGNFRDDKMNGRGEFKLANGDHYVGEFVDGVYSGRGTLRFENGSLYDGDFVNGVYQGRGIYTSQGSRYEGEFVNSQFHGRGILSLANGVRRTGMFAYGKYVSE